MKRIIILVLFLAVMSIFPQEYDGEPCYPGLSLVGKPKYGTMYSQFLINNSRSLTLYEPINDIYPNYYSMWGSSFLKPDNKAPQKYKGFSQGPDNAKLLNPEYVKWSCQYSPSSLVDKDPRTAWSEGVPGDGIGEVVIVRIDITKPIKIWGGFGRNEKLYKENNRPKKIKVHGFFALDCSPGAMNFSSYSNFKYMDSYDYELIDQNTYQPLIISDSILKKYFEIRNELISKGKGDSYCNFNDEILSFIVIEISSVYKGSKYSDTIISEITN
ncbi:hypothetical protein QMN03_17125 [Leptospira santarosai]|uniref:NADase-type glycan-binding domain-containing protein n=1 Tax=Leptospira santarosai TaxID=28183 RepID=UPI0024AECC0F|nr:hypothetical protein [Leptospira santarosai]MDI7208592.1 hypothetical protein [Leptospira santarosai]